MPATTTSSSDVLLRVRGTVQGVGFRPFVHRTAVRLGLRGWVRNDAEGVLLRVAGDVDDLAALRDALVRQAPAAARVAGVEELAPGPDDRPVDRHFTIVANRPATAGIATATPPDLALCADCRRELQDVSNRRHQYPFINCTQCGPRYSLIESLPYERPRTTMRAFRMCPACRAEYDNPRDRRFHAEPNACPVCGPQLILSDASGAELTRREPALQRAGAALADGLIVAVKGIGGYHLMCDATDAGAVAALRQRKHRDEKPFAIMFRSLAQLREHAEVSRTAADLLASPAAPIVLLPRKPGSSIAVAVAPGNPWIGALLPYTPLHVLLLGAVAHPLVATSANLSEEPLCIDNDEAHERLAGLADLFLEHDRTIARPVDDSVIRLAEPDRPIFLRRARGYAPTPFGLPARLPAPVLCLGGQQKNTIAVAAGNQVVLSPHIGDLENVATHRAFERTIEMLGQLQGSRFEVVAHDKHPAYTSTRHAERLGLPRVAVQHHLAHVLSCLLEHRQAAHGVLGVAWDGTGYGEDGTVWGGEFLLLRRQGAERFGRLRPFRLPGGEAAVRDARRVALGLGHEMGAFGAFASRCSYSDHDTALLGTILRRTINSPLCSSAGRLFDGVGALLGLGRGNSFEGQIPLQVEAAAGHAPSSNRALSFPVGPPRTPGARVEVDWQPALEHLLHSREEPAALAAAFHRGLARAIVEVARQAGAHTVVLTGGCFQNALLLHLASAALEDAGFRVLVHRLLPPNDNGLAAGQALAALWNLTTVTLPSSGGPTPNPSPPCVSPFLEK